MKLLSKLNIAKSTGHDNVGARFMKDGRNYIVTPLAYIINLSLKVGVFPDDMKIARVVPLYKKGNINLESNYRPISILPVVSKIIERVVHDQFHQYLVEKGLIYRFQSGFRPNHSTDTALTYLADQIRFNMDKNYYTGVVLLDLQKAFDTVNHDILLKKLKAIGINDTTYAWFSSYLKERKQFVELNGVKSSLQTITCGVPQGSIMGPLMFTIYVNDMKTSVLCDLYLNADDSAMVCSGKNVLEIEQTLSHELSKVQKWLEINRLSLHLGKTESILFGKKKMLKKEQKLRVKCNGFEIESKDEIKYLGLVMDQEMRGSNAGN